MVDAAISAAKSAAQYLGRLAVDEASFLYEVKGKVEELHDELRWMQVFLEDVDTRFGNKDKLVDLWVSQIYDFSYDAEDTMDKYIHRVLRKRKEGIRDTIKWICVMSCSTRDAKTLHEVGNEIDALTQKIAKLTSRMQIYKIEPKSRENSSSSTSLMMELTMTNSLHHFRQPFVSKEWINKLAYGGRVVLSGPAGSGKTTLALATYSNKDVVGHYACRIWIHVADRYCICREIQPGIFAVDNSARDHDEIFSLIELLFDDGVPRDFFSDLIDRKISKVQTNLKMKRYLVVLDDVTVKAWSALERAFHSIGDITCRSQLLVTMRDGEIAPSVGGTLHELGEFADDDVWYLLGEKTGITKHSAGNDEKKSLLKAMLPKCCGRPSLIAQLAGILSTLDDIKDWQTVKKGLGTDVVEDYEGCLRRMNELSYRFLPKHLKPLIIYLAMFPEGYKIRAKKLYRWWTAEGIITTKEEDQVSKGELAEGYLCELVNRGLVQLAGPVNEETGKIKTIKLQDSMRNLCSEKATKDSFLNVVRSSSIITGKYRAPNSRSIRRLAIHMDKKLQDYYGKHADKMSEDKAPYVRSLLLFVTQGWEPERVKKWIKSMSNNYPALRVFIMEYAAGELKLPKEIGNFIHLRVLSFKGCYFGYKTYQLPSTISNLRSLEILDLRVVDAYGRIVIPNVFPSLKQLTHLYFPRFHSAPVFDKFQLDGSIHLETLKNLDLHECREQVFFYSAEELTSVSVPNTVRKKDFLKLKSLVTHPRIRSRSLVKPLALTIDGATFAKGPDVLSGCNSLDRLRVEYDIRYNIFAEVVKSLETLQNLSELELDETNLNEDPMPVLGKLPKLKILRLDCEAYLGKDMEIHASANEFPQLTHLHIVALDTLERWSAEQGAMPNLLELRISWCKQLKTIDGTFPNLANLVLQGLYRLQKWTVVERIAERTKLDTSCMDTKRGTNIKEKNIPEALPPTVKIYHSPSVDGEDD